MQAKLRGIRGAVDMNGITGTPPNSWAQTLVIKLKKLFSREELGAARPPSGAIRNGPADR